MCFQRLGLGLVSFRVGPSRFRLRPTKARGLVEYGKFHKVWYITVWYIMVWHSIVQYGIVQYEHQDLTFWF